MLNNKNYWLNAKTGGEFEDRFCTALKKEGFNQIFRDQIDNLKFEKLKKNITDKLGFEMLTLKILELENLGLQNSYLYQPFGSQNYPDFIIITDIGSILSIEIKSSKSNKPMWNSNLPKENGLYIFSSYEKKDITFWRGGDVLPQSEREELIRFFSDTIKPEEEQYKNILKKKYLKGKYKFERGFNVYTRIAYDQNQTINENAELNYFNANNRKQIEHKVLLFLDNI
jgi:hypothetical protein